MSEGLEETNMKDWPDVYVECDQCGDPRIRGEECSHCGAEAPALTITNLTDQEVDVRIISSAGAGARGPCMRCGKSTHWKAVGGERHGEKLCGGCAAALAAESPVGIGLSDGDTATIREHLLEMEAERVWLGTCDAVLDDLEDATVEDGGLLMDQPATRSGMDLIDPRDGGRWLTVTRPKPLNAPRFGERLREWLRKTGSAWAVELNPLADVIDQDAVEWKTERGRLAAALAEKDTEADDLRQQVAGLRWQVEEAVERLKYSVDRHHGREFPGHTKDVLGAEPFLEELGHIFGGRGPRTTELSALTRFLRDVCEVEAASPDAEDSIVISVGDLEIIAERYIGGGS